jgi:RNA polymerase sigma factor (sigma-70 family)
VITVSTEQVWQQVKPVLFALARKTRQAIAARFDRQPIEAEELVSDAFIELMNVLPRFKPGRLSLKSYAWGVAKRRMWRVAKAAAFGLTADEYHRLEARKRMPRFSREDNEEVLRGVAAADTVEQRQSVGRVAGLRRRLPAKDRALIDVYLESNGCFAEAARRLQRDRSGTSKRFKGLFRRIAASAS